jgi:hypothetical protein
MPSASPWRGSSRKAAEHVRFTHRRKGGQVRSAGNGGHSFRLDPYPPERRTHDDVLAAHGRGADRIGFAIVQYLNRLQESPDARPAYFRTAPEYLRLALISCGVLALVISIWQYRWSIRYLWGAPFAQIAGVTKERMGTPVIAVAILLIGIGVFAFFAVLMRLG